MNSSRKPAPGEHPLMPNRTLRAIYTGLLAARNAPRSPQSPPRRSAADELACWVAPLIDLKPADPVFSGRPIPGSRPSTQIPGAVPRLYASIGAATALRQSSSPLVVAFLDSHELTGSGLRAAFAMAAGLPILLIVLPRWKGADPGLTDLTKAAKLPAIPVDARDPVALYRVAQESILRARAGGGAALLEAVLLNDAFSAGETDVDPAERLAAYLTRRGVVTPSWIASQHASQQRKHSPLTG